MEGDVQTPPPLVEESVRQDGDEAGEQETDNGANEGEDQPQQQSAECIVNAEATQGICSRGPSSMSFIVKSCGDIYDPTVLNRALEAAGHDLTSNKTKDHYSQAWAYMASLNPDDVFLAGDNVYDDAIADWGNAKHPYGINLAVVPADASVLFLKYHGYLTEDG